MMWGVPFRDTWLNVFDTPNKYFIIKDCIVDYENGLIYKDGDILWEAANECIVWTDNWISVDSRWINRIERQELIKERMSKLKNNVENKIKNAAEIKNANGELTLHLLHPFNRYVYGHLFDTLQKMHIVNQAKLQFDSVLLSKTHEIVDFNNHLEALELKDKIINQSDLGLVHVKQLLFICPVSHPTSFTKESYEFIIEKYKNNFQINFETEKKTKLFLTRSKGKFKRYLINEEEIKRKLEEIGVNIIDGSESFKVILNYFSSASHVAGVHGSLFTNNIFGNRKTKYIEFCPANRENHTFHHQYKICESYEHILVAGDEDFNIELDPAKLIEFYNN